MTGGERDEARRISVRIVQLGRGVFPYEGEAGATVEQALSAASVPTAHMEVRVGGRRSELTDELHDGDLVTVIPRIRGGAVPARAAGLQRPGGGLQRPGGGRRRFDQSCSVRRAAPRSARWSARSRASASLMNRRIRIATLR